MDELSYAAAFMIGLLGSTHCIGMCGGCLLYTSDAADECVNV